MFNSFPDIHKYCISQGYPCPKLEASEKMDSYIAQLNWINQNYHSDPCLFRYYDPVVYPKAEWRDGLYSYIQRSFCFII